MPNNRDVVGGKPGAHAGRLFIELNIQADCERYSGLSDLMWISAGALGTYGSQDAFKEIFWNTTLIPRDIRK